MKARLTLGITIVLAGLASQARSQPPPPAAHKPILPLPPSEMLKLMPAAPQGWELKQSHASNNFVDWLTTEAFREFARPPVSGPSGIQSTQDTASPAPMITRIRIMDTGYWPSLTGDFDAFKVSKMPGGETLLFGGLQAMLTPLGKNGQRLRISVKRRFVVQVDALNQPANSVTNWAKLVDFVKLAQIPDSGAEQLPKPIVITTVDELDPRKNSTSKMQWMSDAEIEAASRQTPAR